MSNDIEACTAIVLAAGFSRRFGRDKRLEPLGDGTLLSHTCSVYTSVFDRVVVVLRPGETELVSLLPSSAEVVPSPFAEEGVSQSLVAGLEVTHNSPSIVVALGDMPYIKESTLKLLRNALESNTQLAVRLRYSGQIGNPVGFPSKYYKDLRRLTGDQGARGLLDSGLIKSQILDIDDPGILIDLDQPDDIQEQVK